MLSRRQSALVVAVTAVVSVYTLLAVLLSSLPQDPGTDLSNGTRLRYVTAGVSRIKYTSDTPFHSKFRRHAPRTVQSALGVNEPFEVEHTVRNQLLLLLQKWRPDGQPLPADDHTAYSIHLIESSGFIFEEQFSGTMTRFFPTQGHGIVLDAASYPRRDPQLHFRVLQRNTQKVLLEQTISNPGYQPTVTEWTPQILPITQSSGPVSLTLTGVTAHADTRHLQPHFTSVATDPNWESPDWTVQFSDATGNVGYWLSPFEPAWKVTASVRRRLDTKFSLDEEWTLSPFPPPVPLETKPLKETRTVNGHPLKLLRVFGPGEYELLNGEVVSAKVKTTSAAIPESSLSHHQSRDSRGMRDEVRVSTDLPALWIGHPKLEATAHLEFQVRDQLGRDLQKSPYRDSHSYVSHLPSRWVPFQPFPDSTSIQINVVLHHHVDLDFIIPPLKNGQISASAK